AGLDPAENVERGDACWRGHGDWSLGSANRSLTVAALNPGQSRERKRAVLNPIAVSYWQLSQVFLRGSGDEHRALCSKAHNRPAEMPPGPGESPSIPHRWAERPDTALQSMPARLRAPTRSESCFRPSGPLRTASTSPAAGIRSGSV